MEEKEKAADCGVCIEDCILILENMKERTKQYPVMYASYGEEYSSTLAKVDSAALDKAISVLNKTSAKETLPNERELICKAKKLARISMIISIISVMLSWIALLLRLIFLS